MSGGKKVQDTTSHQVQTAAPPSWTMPGIADVSGKVTGAVGQIPTSHYTGDQVAQANPGDVAAVQDAYKGTAGLAGNYSDWMGAQLPKLSTPYQFQSMLPQDNGYNIQPVIDNALHPLYQQLTQQILPGIKSSALSSGAYTGDRAMMVQPQSAIQAYTDSAARTSGDIGYQDFKDRQQRQLDAYGLETTRGLGQQSANNQSMASIADYVSSILHNSASVGDLLKMSNDYGVSNAQAGIDNQVGMDKYASYAPFMGLDTASQLLAALSGNYGTQTGDANSHTVEKTQPGLLDYIKAGVGIAGMAAGIPGLGLGGSAAAAAGGGLTGGALPASMMFGR